jgi:uncharacterized protein
MEELVRFIVQGLVDSPDDVVITPVEGRDGVTYEISVAPGEAGRLIGRQGRTIQGIRTVVRAIAAQRDEQAYVEVVD